MRALDHIMNRWVIYLLVILFVVMAGCSLFPSRQCETDGDCVNLSCGCLRRGETCKEYGIGTPRPGICRCVGNVCRHVPIDECQRDTDCVVCGDNKGNKFCANTDWILYHPNASKLCKKKSFGCICYLNKCVLKK